MSDETSQSSRWRWMVVALAPSIVSNLLIIAVTILTMRQRTNSPSVAEGGMWLVYGILFMPLSFPIYLYPIARKYVRVFHGGFKSAVPFVLIFSAANLAMWASGICIVGFNMKFEGSSSTDVGYGVSSGESCAKSSSGDSIVLLARPDHTHCLKTLMHRDRAAKRTGGVAFSSS